MSNKPLFCLQIIILLICGMLLSGCTTELPNNLETPTQDAAPTLLPSPTTVPSPTPNPATVTYIDNSSFLVSAGPHKILFDPHYLMPSELKELIMAGSDPFTELDLLLITHEHSDHFDAEIVHQLLHDNPELMLVSTQSVVDQVGALVGQKPEVLNRLHAYEPSAGQRIEDTLNGISFALLNLPHNAPVTNLGFIVSLGDLTLFNTGDIVDLDALDGYNLHADHIDLALIPYFYLSDEGFWDASGSNTLIEAIAPQVVIPSHYSIRRGDLLLHRENLLTRLPDAVLFDEPLDTWLIAE